jgi:hypothetical protein
LRLYSCLKDLEIERRPCQSGSVRFVGQVARAAILSYRSAGTNADVARYLTIEAISTFSPDYETARRRFREAAAALGWERESHAIEIPGATEDLTIDAAISPGDGSQKTLVVSSGLHGVEGFLGSAVQLALLERWRAEPKTAPSVRCVFLHGVNPFGFARLRRCNEENVDLNRNFRQEGQDYKGSPPGYAALDALLNPKRAPSRFDPFKIQVVFTILQQGKPALKRAVAGGQFDFEKGLFYGGSGPSRSMQILAANFPRWLGDGTAVAHLDFHSGLGKWGSCKLVIDYPLKNGQRDRVRSNFGEDSFEEHAADASSDASVAYLPTGSMGGWLVAGNPGRDYLFAFAEFGTYDEVRILAGLRAENQAHHYCRSGDAPAARRATLRLKELFCPASAEWRQRVLSKGVALVEQAAIGLAS